MIVYAMMARGSTLLAEYGTMESDIGSTALQIIAKNNKPGSRLTPVGSNFACILNKTIDNDLYSFLALIKKQEARDLAFDLLERIGDFFTEEKSNNSSKITSEITLHMSRQIRTMMDTCNKSSDRETLQRIQGELDAASNITKTNISK